MYKIHIYTFLNTTNWCHKMSNPIKQHDQKISGADNPVLEMYYPLKLFETCSDKFSKPWRQHVEYNNIND